VIRELTLALHIIRPYTPAWFFKVPSRFDLFLPSDVSIFQFPRPKSVYLPIALYLNQSCRCSKSLLPPGRPRHSPSVSTCFQASTSAGSETQRESVLPYPLVKDLIVESKSLPIRPARGISPLASPLSASAWAGEECRPNAPPVKLPDNSFAFGLPRHNSPTQDSIPAAAQRHATPSLALPIRSLLPRPPTTPLRLLQKHDARFSRAPYTLLKFSSSQPPPPQPPPPPPGGGGR
jgi:hypothetical protein